MALLDPKAYTELGDVTAYYQAAAAQSIRSLLGEFTVHNIRTGKLTDSFCGMLEQVPEQKLVIKRAGKEIWSNKYAIPRDVWCFLHGVRIAREIAADRQF